MIQHTVSKIDFDYMEWGMERDIGRAERGIADPDYPAWLAQAWLDSDGSHRTPSPAARAVIGAVRPALASQ